MYLLLSDLSNKSYKFQVRYSDCHLIEYDLSCQYANVQKVIILSLSFNLFLPFASQSTHANNPFCLSSSPFPSNSNIYPRPPTPRRPLPSQSSPTTHDRPVLQNLYDPLLLPLSYSLSSPSPCTTHLPLPSLNPPLSP